MSISDNPEYSRRLALAMNGANLTPTQQIQAANAVLRANSWKDLPQWLREVVRETERENNGPA